MQNVLKLLRLPESELWLSGRALELAGDRSRALIRRNFLEIEIDLLAPVDWGADPEKNITWRLYFCGMGWVLPFAKLGHERADLAAFAKSCVMSSAQYALEHDVGNNKDFWNDHSTAYRGSFIAYIYADILHGMLTEGEDAVLRLAMSKHREVLTGFLESDKWLLSNHTLFHAEGLADIILTFEKDEAKKLKKLKEVAGFVAEFADRVVTHDEGTVKEHALFYHVFLMGRLKQTSDFFARLGVKETVVAERTYRRMKAFLYRVMPVNGILPGVGDSKHQQSFDQKFIERFKGAEFDSPESQMFDPERLKPELSNAKPEYLARYPTDGFYVSRSYAQDELYSLFLHKPFVGPHGHWDALSFISYHRGQSIFVDSGGPYKYFDELRYRYIQTQLAHNTLIQDGIVSQYHSRMLLAHHDEDSSVLVGGARLSEDLYWVRGFVQFADLCHVVIDWPIATKPLTSPLHVRFHVDPELDMDLDGDLLWITREGRVIADLTSHRFDPPGDPDVHIETLSGLAFELQKPLTENRRHLLPENFEKRAFVTYEDNLVVEGKLADLPTEPNQLNVRQIAYVEDIRIACDPTEGGLRISVFKSGYEKSVVLDLMGLKATA